MGSGGGLAETCRLALLPCPLVGFLLAEVVDGTRPSLGASLPSDMIDSDLPCPLVGRANMGVLLCRGALCNPPLCSPPLEGALTTLRLSVGLCPLPCETCLTPVTDGALLPVPGLVGTSELLLLCAAEGARPKPLDRGVCGSSSSSCSCPGGTATFLNVMMHSISSPAYTLGSLHWTNARMFEGKGGAGMVVEVREQLRAA